jgi:hypothetical protein
MLIQTPNPVRNTFAELEALAGQRSGRALRPSKSEAVRRVAVDDAEAARVVNPLPVLRSLAVTSSGSVAVQPCRVLIQTKAKVENLKPQARAISKERSANAPLDHSIKAQSFAASEANDKDEAMERAWKQRGAASTKCGSSSS